MSSLFAMELSLLPTNNSNNNNSLTTTQRVQQLTSNPNLQSIIKQQVNKSGYVTSAGYKAVLQQFLYSNAVGCDEMDCDRYDDSNINNNKQPQHNNIKNTAQSNGRRPRSISHDETSYKKNNNNNTKHRGIYNPRTSSRRPRSINGSSRFGSIIQSTSNMTTSTMSSMTASITASMNNSKGSLNTSCLNGSILNDSFFGGGGGGKRSSLTGSLGISKRSSLNGSGYSSYPIGTSMTSSTKRSSITTSSMRSSSNTRGGSTISSLTYSKRSTFETFTFDQQDDNSPLYNNEGNNNLAPRKRSDVSITQEQLDMLRKEREGGVRRSDIELRGSSNSRRARLKKLISVKFDPQDDDQEQDAVPPPPPNNGKGRLTGRTFPKEVAVPPSSEDLNPSTSKKDDNAKAKDGSSPVRQRRRRNRGKDKKEQRKDKLLSQRQHQESLHSILSNPRDSITTNRTKSSEENDFDKSFDPQAFLNKLCEEGKSCAQGGAPSDTNKKLCDMMNKKKNVWLPWPSSSSLSKKSLLRTSSSADSNDDSISLSSVMSADDDNDEEDMSKLFNSSSCGGEGGWLSWPDQSSSRSLGKTPKENRRTKLFSDSTTQPVTTLPLSSTSSSIKSSRARAA